MTSKNYFAALSLAILSLSGLGISNSSVRANELNTQGGKGARIYCYMRNSGNAHEVSWNASYALIKRQTNSMFKTSPKHAAVMITEAVVQQPDKYPNCGQYLGDLFNSKKQTVKTAQIDTINNENNIDNTGEYTEESASRYTY